MDVVDAADIGLNRIVQRTKAQNVISYKKYKGVNYSEKIFRSNLSKTTRKRL